MWETTKGKLQHEFKGLSTSFDYIALSSDGKYVALMGGGDPSIHLI